MAVETEGPGFQFTLNGGWVGKLVATLAAALVIALVTAVLQMQFTRFTDTDGAKLEVADKELSRLIEVNRQSVAALKENQAVNTQRLKTLELSIDDVKEDTEWIRRRLETGK